MDGLDGYFSSGNGSDGMEEDSGTCAATVSDNSTLVLPSSLHNGLIIFQIIYTFILLVSGTALNSLIIFLISKFRELKTVSFSIALQLSAINLSLSLVCGTTILITQFAGKWILGAHFCIFIGFMLFSFSFLRTLLIFVFALDKFLVVFAPFAYPKINGRIVATICVVFWIFSFLHSLIFIPEILDCYDFLQPAMTCFFSPRCNENCELFYYIMPLTVSPGVLGSVFLFLGLYIKGRRLRLKHRKMMPKDECKISKHDWRALNTFALLCSAVFVITLPPFVTVLICQSLETNMICFLAVIVAMNVTFLHVIIDALIIMRNADFKKCFKKLTRKLKRTRSKKNLRSAGNSTINTTLESQDSFKI